MINTAEEIRLTFPFGFRDRVFATFLLTSQRMLSIVLAAAFPTIGIAVLLLAWMTGRPLDVQVWAVVSACLAFYPLTNVVGIGLSHITRPHMREPFTYLFDDAGIHVSATSYEFTHRWSTISRVKKLGAYLMFFYAPGCAHCVPLGVIREAGALQSLLVMARANGARTDLNTESLA